MVQPLSSGAGRPLTRRSVLGAALSGVCAGFAWRAAPAAVSGTAITPTPLGGGLYLFQGAGGNVVASAGEGLLLVDGGLAEHSVALLDLATRVTGRPRVDVLFNTHWHWSHTGSNAAAAKAGARIVAHENTRLWLGTHVNSRWEQRIYPPLPEQARPTRTFFYGVQQLDFGGQQLEYALLPQAHTDGDIYVFFPRANVLVGGGVVAGGGYPLTDWCTGGWLGGMIDGLDALIAKADSQTRIIPGDGPVRTRADLLAQKEMCQQVIGRIGTSYFKGDTWEQLRASRPTREFDGQWGDPDRFLQLAYDGAWYHVNDIRRYGSRRPGA